MIARFDASAADAYLVKSIGPASTYTITLRALFPQATLDALITAAAGSPAAGATLIYLGDGDPNVPGVSYDSIWEEADPPAYDWAFLSSAATLTASLSGDVWTEVSFEAVFASGTSWNVTWKINGVTVGTQLEDWGIDDSSPVVLSVGGIYCSHVAGETYFLDDVLVKNELGATLFSDDFEGDLSGWDSVVGAASIVEGPISAPPAPPEIWTVTHLLGGASSDRGTPINVVRPENLHFVLNEGVVGPDEIEYELTLSAKDESGDPAVFFDEVDQDFVAAKRTDWELRRGELVITAGEHVAAPTGDAGAEFVKIAGRSYLGYLQDRVWPYDATLSYVNWPDGLRFTVSGAGIGQIVKDILETIRDLSANFPAAPDDPWPLAGPYTGHPSFSMPFTVDVDVVRDEGGDPITINYEISAFEPSSIYDLIQSLAQADRLQGGFSFGMTWDRVFWLRAPEVGDPDSPIYTLEVDATSHLSKFAELGFTNTGPECTHVLGVGSGTANRQGGINRHFRLNSNVFCRRDKVADFSEIKNLDELIALTSEALSFGANPVHEIPVVVNAKAIPRFWEITKPGEYIQVTYDLGFHKIDSVQKIVSMTCDIDLNGNERVEFGLNQHYVVDPSTGLADW